jgi:SAM-dependent methyltransferase
MATTPASLTPAGGDSVRVLSEYVAVGSADLVITATAPHAVDDRRADAVALLAARLLRPGGTLAVLTHSDWTGGVLHDPIGTVVTAAQSADLLYLQHLVAVHQPLAPNSDPTAQRPDPDLGQHVPKGHGSELHGSERHGPGRHRRVHSDVLVLVQPHDHALDLPNAAAA